MNISANTLSYLISNNMTGISGNKNSKKEEKDQKKDLTPQEIMIKQFKEDHSPEKERLQQIYGKFRAGKDLSEDELKYLAQNNPQAYKEIQEIREERAAMEKQMEQAETKQEVAAVHLNELTRIKQSMGNPSQAKSQAMKNMARVNQMESGYVEYTATLEYREKEDEESQALERREALLEEALQLEENTVKAAQKEQEEITESDNTDETNMDSTKQKEMDTEPEEKTLETAIHQKEQTARELEKIQEEDKKSGNKHSLKKTKDSDTTEHLQSDPRLYLMKLSRLYQQKGTKTAEFYRGLDIQM